MKKTLTQRPPATSALGSILRCPECGATIPVAEAVEQAVAARTASAQQAERRFQRKEAELNAETEGRLSELEDRLAREHAEQVAELQEELRTTHAQCVESLNKYMDRRDKEAEAMRHSLDAARVEAAQKFQEGRSAAQNQMKTLQVHLEKSQAEQAQAKEAQAKTEAKLASAQFDQRAAFEKGRSAALEASQRQIQEHQKLLDEVRSQSFKREKELDKKLAQAIREAEEHAATQGARKLKAAMDAALEGERERLGREVGQEHAVERQRFETQIQRLRQEIESLHRKAESGPSEVTGDAAEDVLERELRDAFQTDGDTLKRASKGQKAADLTLAIARAGGRKLLVESKWTQAWESGWIAKAKEDRAAAGAEAVVIVSRTLPNGVKHLTQVDDVWVASHQTALALVTALRQGLIAVERAKRAANMDETRVRELKGYLSGPQFREQVEAMVSLTQGLIDGQTRERTQHDRAWKEGRAAFDRILASALGIWTDLELASGQSLQASQVLAPYLAREEEQEFKPKGRCRRAA